MANPSVPESLVLTGATCRLYRMPLIYIWRRGEEVLYVGKSMQGITRPFEAAHRHTPAMESDDTLELLLRPYACSAGLLSEEARLIARLQPRLNTHSGVHYIDAHPDDCPLSGEHVQQEREERARQHAESVEKERRRRLEAKQAERLEGLEGLESPATAAAKLAVSQTQVDEWLDAGAMPSVPMGGRERRIRQRDLRVFAHERGLQLTTAAVA